MNRCILILGGARSGKSQFAQELALIFDQPVLFVATAEAGDEEMKERIEEHKRERPTTWNTLEVTTHIGSQIEQRMGTARVVIVDCVTLLVSNIFNQHSRQTDEKIDTPLIEKEVSIEIDELVKCIDQIGADFIIVSNELGLGLVPADEASRLYRDLLGRANQVLAKRADEVYLMVAGLPLPIKSAEPF